MEATVADASAAATQASSGDFVDFLTGLPAETTVSDVTAPSTETVSLEITVYGVTDANKDQVCASVASALGGVSTYCSYGSFAQDSTLFMEATVADASAAATQASSGDFVDFLTGLPAETTVSDVTP